MNNNIKLLYHANKSCSSSFSSAYHIACPVADYKYQQNPDFTTVKLKNRVGDPGTILKETDIEGDKDTKLGKTPLE